MDLDVYQPCPCGGGKKLKFCCCNDILPELDRVLRILDGDQRAAGLDAIDKILVKYPGRAALLALKATVLAEEGKFEEALQAADACLEKSPTSSVALSLKALGGLGQGKTVEAIDLIQQAIESCGEQIPVQVYQSLYYLAGILLRSGHPFAGRAHMVLAASYSGSDDSPAMADLMRINGSTEIPLLLKTDAELPPFEGNAQLKEEYDAASSLSNEGQWRKALAKLHQIAAKAPRDPSVLRSIALLSASLGREAEAVDALRRLVANESLSLDDRVEAEAMAQILDPASYKTLVDELDITITLHDVDKAQERLLSDRRASFMSLPADAHEEGEPPPKSFFYLLDRPLPTDHANLALADVPRLRGRVILYGKQTDRPARMIVGCSRNEHLTSTLQTLRSIVGDAADEGQTEEVVGKHTLVSESLRVELRAPDRTPREVSDRWVQEERKEAIFGRWIKTPLDALGGKSPADAARDLAHSAPPLAAVLTLEARALSSSDAIDYNELRRKLGLPTADLIDPTKLNPMRIPPVRFARLRVEKLTDESLSILMRRAAMYGCSIGLKRLVEEGIKRPEYSKANDLSPFYGALAMQSPPREALAYYHQARDITVARRRSPARWLLAELGLHIALRNVDEIQRLIPYIQTAHGREPGVSEGLYSILVQSGLVRPAEEPMPGMAPGAAELPAAAAAPAGIWTPDAPAAAPAASGGEKSKLWIPGA